MSHKLDPQVVARDVANALCNQYVSSISITSIDDVKTHIRAAEIYASAYDSTYDYIVNENKLSN